MAIFYVLPCVCVCVRAPSLPEAERPRSSHAGRADGALYCEEGEMARIDALADDPNMSGPLGALLVQRLTDPISGIVLDSWLDSDVFAV